MKNTILLIRYRIIKKLISFKNRRAIIHAAFMITAALCNLSGLSAQAYSSITGQLVNSNNEQAVEFANILLYEASDSKLIEGRISDSIGKFTFNRIKAGNYRLTISLIGYEPFSSEIEIGKGVNYDAGVLFLKETVTQLNEVVVTGERSKSKAEKDKTVYFMTKKIAGASATGLDALKFVPGIQIDLRQNISLEGNKNILILVDGKERDKNYVSQLKADQIDKMEVISAPSSKYDGNVDGVINIVLKRPDKTGINGQINLEIPTTKEFIFIHPSYDLNLNFKKITLYTSCNSEIINANQHEYVYRNFTGDRGYSEVHSDQYVKQKYWSYRFHYGLDYFINPKNNISFYAYYNPFSQVYNGTASATDFKTENWQANRINTNNDHAAFYSIYYKLILDDKGSEISAEVSDYHLKTENINVYKSKEEGNSTGIITNVFKPVQNYVSAKLDGNYFLMKGMNLSFGAKTKLQNMSDDNAGEFKYGENITGLYSFLEYSRKKFDMNIGLRLENSISELTNEFQFKLFSILPGGYINFKISEGQSLKFSASRSVERPNIYQLDPTVSIHDPYTVQSGNPALTPGIKTFTFIEYSRKFKTNYFSSRLFFNKNSNCISYATFLNDTLAFETGIYNLGVLHQYGLQLSGTFKIGKLITIVPYFRIFNQNGVTNDQAKQFAIENFSQVAFESNVSALFTFKRDINLMLNYQYSSPKRNMQVISFSDALYIIKLEKNFSDKYKVGISSGLPFTKTFTYQGSEIKNSVFNSTYIGDIDVPGFFVWFNFTYRFESGMQNEKINKNREVDDVPLRKGI